MHYEKLSKQYRETGKGELSRDEVAAYEAGRMPATLSALTVVLREIGGRVRFVPKTLLDIGAGPGTGYFAFREVFGAPERASLVEINPHMISAGKKRIDSSVVDWRGTPDPTKEWDLILFGYSFGELDQKERMNLLATLYPKAKVVVIVEPGTPRGYMHMLEGRDYLLSLGGKMIAPCPHEKRCPMEKGDWCHFATRLARTKEHKRVKEAERGFEDEKYSYVAIGKEEITLTKGRVLRTPLKRKGHVELRLCLPEGIENQTISKKEGEGYKWARKAKWGASLFSESVVEESDDTSPD